jgi:endonuclease YncB( thermonuclease family)
MHWLRRVDDSKLLLSEKSIHVRIMGVDAPESAAFGMPSQPYSKHARVFLEVMLSTGRRLTDRQIERAIKTDLKYDQNSTVWIRPLRRDQYGRVVGAVAYTPSFWLVPRFICKTLGVKRDVSVDMVRAGYAVVYKSAGAEYDGRRSLLETLETAAKHKKIGMWRDGKGVVTPAEHKKKYLK